VRIPEGSQNRIGIGKLTKRDAVIVRVETDEGVVGWGESHHGRNPGAIANIVDNAIGPLVLGMDPLAVTDAWQKVYRYQLASHGVGAGSVIAMSGVDMALWDIRGKVTGWPLYKLLGGTRKGVPAYAGGGGALGFRPEAELAEEAIGFVEQGFKALKLRLGDNRRLDVQRVAAVRKALGDEIIILTDANSAYSLEDARYVIPALVELGVGWLEEPFPAHDIKSYQMARSYGTIPFALGENNYTRFEFTRLIEEGLFQVLQPDVAKAGGVTEIMRIAATASAWKIPVHPHGGVTGLDHAAGIHVLASIENSGYFESSEGCNPLREGPFLSKPYEMDKNGLVYPLEAPGIGLEVDEAFLATNPLIEGPGFG
jgi:L-alanine-DL-glutamate epimerase-like enolase superfamily enzyme